MKGGAAIINKTSGVRQFSFRANPSPCVPTERVLFCVSAPTPTKSLNIQLGEDDKVKMEYKYKSKTAETVKKSTFKGPLTASNVCIYIYIQQHHILGVGSCRHVCVT